MTGSWRGHKLKVLGFFICAAVVTYWLCSVFLLHNKKNRITAKDVAQSLSVLTNKVVFPQNVQLHEGSKVLSGRVEYTIDQGLQARIERILHQYHPDYAAFVALDAKTGRVLSLASYNHGHPGYGDLALRATFPTASVFKVVTATAALDRNLASINTEIAFNGALHTLYKHNVEDTVYNRWTHHITLRQAFAKSVDTAFGKLGLFRVGPKNLREYANRFLFNQTILADFPVSLGFANINNNGWDLAQVASGFTHHNTIMSPVQGALIAAAVANNGVMMDPTLVDKIYGPKGKVLYHWHPQVVSVTMSHRAAREMQAMMRATVQLGTGHLTFYHLRRQFRELGQIEVGGKTGHLTGLDPVGTYDWFVGYGKGYGRTLAVAALTINVRRWHVRSARLAGDYMVDYFNDVRNSMPARLASYNR